MAKDKSEFFKTKNSWSVIKDELLGCYIKPYFQKILMTGKPICYVDCFAGKGLFEDGSEGSPLIVLGICEEVIKQSNRLDKYGSISTCFIESDYADELRENIEKYHSAYSVSNVISGKYEDVIERYLSSKRGQNVFLYIDPYGIKSLDAALFDSFNSYGFNTFEMLINFNSFGFFRDACRVMKVSVDNDKAFAGLDELIELDSTVVTATEQSSDMLTRIAGGDYWKAIVADYNAGYIDGYQAEQRLSVAYKNRLKKSFKYVLDMPIRLKTENRPKYRMIHVCNHEDGCYLMAQNMQNRKNELFINIQQRGQLSIFDIAEGYASTIEGVYITEEEVEEKVHEFLADITFDIHITRFLAEFTNTYGLICDFKMIYVILEKMQMDEKIEIIRIPDKTEKGRTSRFWDEKGSHKVILRRMQQ